MRADKWDLRFFEMAVLVAGWSKDPDRRVGAVLVSPDRRRIAVGYNGFPQGAVDEYGLVPLQKLRRTVHAELNCVLNARADVAGWTMYSTRFPCADCANAIVQAGVARLVCPMPDGPKSRWAETQGSAMSMLLECGVTVCTLDEGEGLQ